MSMQILNVPFQHCCPIIVLHKPQILFKFNCSASSTHQHSPPHSLSLPQISFPKICTCRFFKVQLKHNFWQKFFPSTPIGNNPFFSCILYSPSKMCNTQMALITFSQKGLLQSLLRSIPIFELFSSQLLELYIHSSAHLLTNIYGTPKTVFKSSLSIR